MKFNNALYDITHSLWSEKIVARGSKEANSYALFCSRPKDAE